MGLAFKPDVDDLRESAALEIVKELEKINIGELLVSEPNISSHNMFSLCNYQDAIERADIIVLLVKHKEFNTINHNHLNEKIVLDTCGVTKR